MKAVTSKLTKGLNDWGALSRNISVYICFGPNLRSDESYRNTLSLLKHSKIVEQTITSEPT